MSRKRSVQCEELVLTVVLIDDTALAERVLQTQHQSQLTDRSLLIHTPPTYNDN